MRNQSNSLLSNLFLVFILIPLFGLATYGFEIGRSHDRRLEMVEALHSPSAHKSIAQQSKLFDRLVGTWDVEYSVFESGGKVTRSKGEVLFGWVLDGRVLQDIWITYPESNTEERKIGTTVRFYDAKTNTWRILWVDPVDGDIAALEGGPDGNRIIFNGKNYDGGILRWSFNDIQENSFVWRGEVSNDKGKNWKLHQEHKMKRRNT
jgi:hypothetical protein